MDKTKLIIFLILALGLIYRLIISSGGNFIFNMDNARDMVDVREMVVSKHLRLIGPTSAIDGFYNGPGWYYLLSIPFLLSGGNPYASILMEIMLWAVGGYFLLKLTSRWGLWSMVLVGSIWVASNFVLLASQYAFNPNPVIFLTPFLIYLLEKYLEKGEMLFSILLWFLAGLFLQFEMATGILIPAILLTSIFLLNKKLFKLKSFWVGVLIYIVLLMPQILFDLKHEFIMTKSVLTYLSLTQDKGQVINPLLRLRLIATSFYDTILPTFENFKFFTKTAILFFFIALFIQAKKGIKAGDKLFFICSILILVSFVGYTLLPITVNRWHLDAVVVTAIITTGFILKTIIDLGKIGKFAEMGIVIIVIVYSLLNIQNYLNDLKKPNNDPASYKNEISSIDYVYQKADGKNFKVYTYLPSVIDYPYQYLFWWIGLKRYGYIPEDYAYAPNKPAYIAQKDKLSQGSRPSSSGLIFLIKQPDQNGIRHLWENQFKNLELILTEKVGPNVIEIRKEI